MLPVEVKYRNRIDAQDTSSITKFMKKQKAGKGIIVTKDVFGEKEVEAGKILLIPAWLFMMTV